MCDEEKSLVYPWVGSRSIEISWKVMQKGSNPWNSALGKGMKAFYDFKYDRMDDEHTKE